MKRQLTELRETTTRFDMSFDAAVTRLEERVDRIEDQQAAPLRTPVPTVPTSEPQNVLVQGQGRQ
jgi:hypothetical protein